MFDNTFFLEKIDEKYRRTYKFHSKNKSSKL